MRSRWLLAGCGVLLFHIIGWAHGRPGLDVRASYTGALFDAHAHTTDDVSTTSVFDSMRRNSVTGIFLYGPSAVTAALQRTNSDLVNPYSDWPKVTSGGTTQLQADSAAVSYIDGVLRNSVMKGIGEVPMRHSQTMTATYTGYPPDGPIAMEIWRLAAQYRVIVNFHVEHEYAAELENAVRQNPNTIFVWAHMGDGPSTTVGPLLRAYPNLYTDISTRNPYMKTGKPSIPLADANTVVLSDWKALFEELPDRFLFGIDVESAERAAIIDSVIEHYRAVLGQLTPATAEKIGRRNAEKLLQYARTGWTLTVTKSGGGSGTVSSSPAGVSCGADCSEPYAQGSSVTLTPAPDATSAFAGWTGDTECLDGVVSMSDVHSCGAAFVTKLSASASPGLVDLNGDGGADVFRYNSTTGAWSMEFSQRNGAFGSMRRSWGTGWIVQGGDFTGDGLTDQFLYNASTGQWFKAINTGLGDFSYYTSTWSTGWSPIVLDLNGDRLADVFLYNAASGTWFKCLSVGSGDFSYHAGTWAPGWELYPADWNGDRKADLFLYNRTSGVWVRATSDGGAAFTYVSEAWASGWRIFPGDFNGDGRSDIFLYSDVTGAWFICTNTGSGFTYKSGQWSSGWRAQLADFDANGKADVFLYDPATGSWFECVNNGAADFTYFSGTWSAGWATYATDLNGDRRSDLLLYSSDTGQWFQCLNGALGAFTYTNGSWEPGLTVVVSETRLP